MPDDKDTPHSATTFNLTIHGGKNNVAQGQTVHQTNLSSPQEALKSLEAFQAELQAIAGVPEKARQDVEQARQAAQNGQWVRAKTLLLGALQVLAVSADLIAVYPVLHDKGSQLIQLIGSLPQ